ncbi:MAG: hypothetical protein WKF84_06860 [Pyrinomonadaceae bacterium]
MIEADLPGVEKNERVLRRFRFRQRRLVEADMLVLANDHWNLTFVGSIRAATTALFPCFYPLDADVRGRQPDRSSRGPAY